MKLNKTFIIGFLSGVLLASTAAGLIWFRFLKVPENSDVIAEINGKKLTQEELRKRVASDLTPIENDEYRILERSLEEWRDTELLEKEAKAQKISLEELDRKEIWSKVQVSSEDVSAYYNKNQKLYNQPLEKINSLILQELRRNKYEEGKSKYLAELEKKYAAKNYLKKPASFVEGLNLPAPIQKVSQEGVETFKTLVKAVEGPTPGETPSRGSKTAPITLMEFADFHCPFCKHVSVTLKKLLENYPDKVRLVFRHFPLAVTPGAGSFLTHEAAACAQEQGKFWEFHDSIFAFEGVPAEADLYKFAETIGLDKSKFEECVKSHKYDNFLQAEREEGRSKNVQGTPVVFVNDKMIAGAFPYENFVEVILNPDKAPKVPSTSPPAPTPTAPVQFNDLEGRPSIGPKNAPVTLVEFADFHCPFCKWLTPTLDKLIKQYPEQIRRVWRHYPLAIHFGADRTHEASECAHEQGKFWPYHDKLFETQGGPRDDQALVRLAEQVGLKKKKFEKCLSSGKYKDLIQKEIAAGNQVGVQGTPAVFVNGKLVSGAQPFEKFDQLVKDELKKS